MRFRDEEPAHKLRGGYYTDPDITSFLTQWVLENKPRTILEPSCGDGRFLEAVQQSTDGGRIERIQAFEIVAEEAAKARKVGRKLRPTKVVVTTGDYLEFAIDQMHSPPMFDAVVGNPPFIRYQYLAKPSQDLAQRLFAELGLRFTKHTNAWVPFVLAALSQLRPGGRLAMVVPAELLHVLHAQSLREYLLQQCSRVLLVDPVDLWFEKTLQGVMLLLAEKKPQTDTESGRIAVVPVRDRSSLVTTTAGTLFQESTFTSGESCNGKWTLALLPSDEQRLFRQVIQNEGIFRFSEIASVDVGIVTGANKFFLVSDDIVERYELHPWAHPMFGRSEHVNGVVYDMASHQENRRRGLPANFVWFGDEPMESLPAKVRKYIRIGESQRLHERYKCRIRSPWYAVPSVYATQVGMLKRSHHFPRLILNRAKALTTDTAYRIRPKGVAARDLVVAFVNSLTALSAELEGRHYGGGVLELVPSEIEKLVIPTGTPTPRCLDELNRLVRTGASADQIMEEQDEQILRPLGISKQACSSLRQAWLRLRNRRQRN